MNNNKLIEFIGTGGVFDYLNGNSAALLRTDVGTVLIDCGYTVYPKLAENNLIGDIDYILITHLHGDHVGSIHPLILHLANKCKKRVRIIFPTESFRNVLKNYFKVFLVDVERYVDFIDIQEIPSLGYVNTTNRHVDGMESYAYYCQINNICVYYSGDLGDISLTKRFLIHKKNEENIVFHETSFIEGKAHVHYKDLMKLAETMDVPIYAYHCDYMAAPSDCTLEFVAEHKEFCL